MVTIGVFEAKASLGQLAQSAAKGEVVLLTRRVKPLADNRPDIEALRKFRRANRVESFDLAGRVAEGRRRCPAREFLSSIAR